MKQLAASEFIAQKDDLILVTGATGFIGSKVVQSLLQRGFERIRCLARTRAKALQLAQRDGWSLTRGLEVFQGNLLSPQDCETAVKGAAVVIHLAAGRGEKSFPDAFMNSVVATRNLLDACVGAGTVRRIVNVSSFVVYTNNGGTHGNLLDETCATERHPETRGEAYCYAKTRQEQLVTEYGQQYGLPFVHIRPGAVYGPGNPGITARVGIGTFGTFLHLGGSNPIPLTYVDNCADAIVLAALTAQIDGEAFNVVDDDLPTSRQLLRLYKRHVRKFRSLYVPKPVSYLLCYAWERYSTWSEGQLPPVFNRKRWNSFWKKTRYTNQKLKARTGWHPSVHTREGLQRYFDACRRESVTC